MKILFLIIIIPISFYSFAQSDIIFFDDFLNNKNGWDIGVEASEVSSIKDGRYNIKVIDTKNWHWFGRKIPLNNYDDLIIKTTIIQQKRNSDDDLPGIIWNATDDLKSFYLLLIDVKNEEYCIKYFHDQEYFTVKDWFPSDFLSDKKLEIEITKRGEYYSFYINRNYLTSKKIEATNGDNFGYYAGPRAEYWVEDIKIVKYDNFQTSSNNLSGSKYLYLTSACSYDRSIKNESIIITEPKAESKNLMRQIFDYSGLYTQIETYGINTNDIGISFIDNNKRYILLNEGLLDGLQKSNKDYWANLSVLAHEIGHHLDGHTLINEISKTNYAYQQWEKEWIADFYSGYILSKMGATVDEAISGVKRIIPEDYWQNSPNVASHPDRYSRIVTIKNGYYKAKYFSTNINTGLREIIKEDYKAQIAIEEKNLEKIINSYNYKTNGGFGNQYYDYYENLNFSVRDGNLIQKYTCIFCDEDEQNFIVQMPIRNISSIECLPIDDYINIYTSDKVITKSSESKSTRKRTEEKLFNNSILINHLSQPKLQEELSKSIFKLKLLYSIGNP